MCFRRVLIHGLLWISIASLVLPGCQTTQTEIPEPRLEDDFGEFTTPERITEESVHRKEMLRQRAQLELALGGAFPFSIFDPSEDPLTDPAPIVRGKFSFEAFKDLFFSLSADWAQFDVDDPAEAAEDYQIQNLDEYDKLDFLLGFDYDIPLFDDADSIIFRFGLAAGVVWVMPHDRIATPREVEDFFQFVLRPAIGLRYPVTDHLLLFGELSYDWVPERSLVTTESERISGERPVFGSGAVWFGLAWEWD